MKILLSAFECNPLIGSDPYVGWSWVIQLAKNNEVFVLLREDHKPYIEEYCKDVFVEHLEHIHFYYIKTSDFLWKKVYKYNTQLAVVGQYAMWQWPAYQTGKKIVKNNAIDVCHVVSMADFRFPGYLWKLPVPYIFGPVGGGQEAPKCLDYYIKGHTRNEIVRSFMNRSLIKTPNYKRALQKAAYIFYSNDETRVFMEKYLQSFDVVKLKYLTELGINKEYLDKRMDYKKTVGNTVHIFVVGRLIYRKGCHLLFDALKDMKCERKYVLDIYGDGEERDKLNKLVEEYSLTDKVVFHGNIHYKEMQEEYKRADIYCLPSLRETTGTAVFEAMANKLPIVALNQNGAKRIVKDSCGILVDVISREQIIHDLGLAIKTLIENDSIRLKYGENAFKEIYNSYTWENKVKYMEKIYEDVCNGQTRTSSERK